MTDHEVFAASHSSDATGENNFIAQDNEDRMKDFRAEVLLFAVRRKVLKAELSFNYVGCLQSYFDYGNIAGYTFSIIKVGKDYFLLTAM